TPCPTEQLVLQVPLWPLLEGDTVTLHCRGRRDMLVSEVRFYRGDKELRKPLRGTEFSLSALQLHHSGDYWCRGWVTSKLSLWTQSARTIMKVHGEHHTATT
ncbi:FCGR2 protein, partial [Hippolais icterina]|nr:FCGR2 protein [Hippolais icterina]